MIILHVIYIWCFKLIFTKMCFYPLWTIKYTILKIFTLINFLLVSFNYCNFTITPKNN